MIRTEIRKCIINRFFVGSVLLTYFFYMCSYSKGVTYVLDDTTHLFHALYVNIDISNAQWLKALLAVVPFVFVYFEEWNSGEYYNVMCRTGYKRFIVGKSVAVFVTGFLEALISIFLFFITLIILTKGKWEIGADRLGVYDEGTILEKIALEGNQFPLLFNEIFTRCLSVATTAMVGLALYTFIKSKYLAIVAPFFVTIASGYIYYTLANITKQPVIHLLHPNNLMSYMSSVKQNLFFCGIPFTYAVFVTKIVFYIILFMYGVGRRRNVG